MSATRTLVRDDGFSKERARPRRRMRTSRHPRKTVSESPAKVSVGGTSSTSASPTEFYATAAPTAVAGEIRRIT
jgi:hypothetical protein